jgi:hypothetical protein
MYCVRLQYDVPAGTQDTEVQYYTGQMDLCVSACVCVRVCMCVCVRACVRVCGRAGMRA